jgi:glycosyltransferase involved in cell wall biosynthesis
VIIHFTTVHPRDDSRIRDKELGALQNAFGGPVAMYVQDGLGDEIDRRAGFPIIDTGPRMPRLKRMTVGAWRMIRAVLRARPKVAHFHDPELVPWAMLLTLAGIKVVYDVHEDYPRQVLHNGRLPAWVRAAASPTLVAAEWIGARLFSGMAVATEEIADRFPAPRTILVRNFPILGELHAPDARPMSGRPAEFTYIGTITQNRNIFRMMEAVDALPGTTARLRLAGDFVLEADRTTAEAMIAWRSVTYEGWLSREGVAAILSESRAGLVLLKPVPHEMVTLPIKLFEYMAAGLPVISSDFPLWREIVEGAGCGLLVDPRDTSQITAAMQWILDHPAEAEAMGRRGREAVETTYSWEREKTVLIDFYRNRLGITEKAA